MKRKGNVVSGRKPLTFDVERSPPTAAEKPKVAEARQQVGARVPTASYRKLKARAALQGVTVQTLVEQAIAEFLVNHPD